MDERERSVVNGFLFVCVCVCSQYKICSWLALIFCAQSLANMRNLETDLKQISMAMMYVPFPSHHLKDILVVFISLLYSLDLKSDLTPGIVFYMRVLII